MQKLKFRQIQILNGVRALLSILDSQLACSEFISSVLFDAKNSIRVFSKTSKAVMRIIEEEKCPNREQVYEEFDNPLRIIVYVDVH